MRTSVCAVKSGLVVLLALLSRQALHLRSERRLAFLRGSIPLFALILCALFLIQPLHAHPMGNFSVNHYSRIVLGADGVEIDYFIDLAEIPAYQELQAGNITATPHDPAVLHFLAARGAELGRGLSLLFDGQRLPLQLMSYDVLFPSGAGGLPTMKMGFVYRSPYPAGVNREHLALHFSDNNYPGHSGWKEIIAVDPAGALLQSSVPSHDRSAALTNYPSDLLTSPPQDLDAFLEAKLPPPTKVGAIVSADSSSRLAFKATVPSLRTKRNAVTPKNAARSAPHPPPVALPAVATASATPGLGVPLSANQQRTPRDRFTELMTTQHLSLWFLLTAAMIAVSLGGLHALEPGHGKTIVAAYLVGSRGTARHAVLLGIIVTASHTAGVFALGAITLYASRFIVPEQLYPWLGMLSGLTIAGLGCYMLLRRLTGSATEHSHLPGDVHDHWFSRFLSKTTTADDAGARQTLEARHVSYTQLFTLGITGGIIPCPAALIVLLSAFALHRIAFGFFLIVAFSVGLAAVLIGFGALMVYARRFMTRLQMDGPLTKRWLPVLSSTFITVLGCVVAFQASSSVHLHGRSLTEGRLGPALFVMGLGLVLGMKHSTDADHVVAISTIVSRQRSIRNAAFIGSVWGLGHTLTIFAVGSLIILFGVEIPTRVGLSMEFSVALMLIILGVLNLTGVMGKITARVTPSLQPSTSTAFMAEHLPLFPSPLRRHIGRLGAFQFLRPLIIGLIHGLAGSAAVALLVLSTIHSPVWATVYLLIFGAGTMLGMMCMTAAIAVPLTYAGNRFSKLSHYFGVASGLVSVSFGSFLVYQLGYLSGLFTSHPEWTPH